MVSRESAGTALFRLGFVAVFLFMMVPLLVVVSSSFTSDQFLVFPPRDVSFKWYVRLLNDQTWIRAFQNSLITATGTMVLSTTLGVLAALGLRGVGDRLSKYVSPLVLLPLLISPVIIAVTLLIYFSKFGLQQSYVGIIIAHSLWGIPFVFFIMQAVLTRVNWELKDAAMDLGAGPFRTFFEVTLPEIKHGIFAAALIAFIISLQEFIMTLFLSGIDTRTVPVLAWNSLRTQVNPFISVVSTLLIAIVVAIIIPASLVMGFRRLSRQL